jgi:hypothetical protein
LCSGNFKNKILQASNVFTGLSSGNYSTGVVDATGQFNYAIARVYNKCPTITAMVNSSIAVKANNFLMAG